MEKISQLLASIYQPEDVSFIKEGIEKLWEKYSLLAKSGNHVLTEKDVVLITYGDQVYKNKEDKLSTLRQLLHTHLKEQISIVHILPFYPYTSDDGFSITDYYAVNPELGNWDEVKEISQEFRLLFDAVINHNSSESDWFRGFLEGDENYRAYYYEVDASKGFDDVVRPRTSPLTHTFISDGQSHEVWTTFSRDQVDLNYTNPKLLLQILDLLLFYATKGASIIRLDAIGFMWKEINTNCIHLPQTHQLIKLMREVVGYLNPSIMLLTETNVPHEDNISYFGNGDEAHMVYNFTLPPLLAFSILNETTEKLSKWVSQLVVPYKSVCYFNFLASHDGVGVMPVHDILNANELNVLISSAKANSGKVSYKTKDKGEEIPYEINCNYMSLLQGLECDESLGIKRSLLAHAILLTMPGLPAIYFHSIFGSVNDLKGLEESGQNRRINRKKFEYNYLNDLLKNPISRESIMLLGIKRLIDIRKNEPAFDPYGKFEVMSPFNGVFGLSRKTVSEKDSIYGYFNLTQKPVEVQLEQGESWLDIISSNIHSNSLSLKPLGFVWLKKS